MARSTRKRIHKKKRGGAIGQFFDEIGSSFKGLVSRTRKKGAEIIDQGSRAVSSAVKGTETTVSNVGQGVGQTMSSTANQVQRPTRQMMGGKKRRMGKSRKSRKSRKSHKSRKSKKMMGGKKRRMRKSRKSRKSRKH